MSPRGPSGHTLGLLLLLGVAACLWLPSEGQDTEYRRFLKRNVDNPKSNYGHNNNYCYKMMRLRGLKCVRRNDFIHASEEQLKAICRSRGRILQGTVTSKTLFSITSCRRRKVVGRLFCWYKGKSRTRKIRVVCERGLPVRYISSKK